MFPIPTKTRSVRVCYKPIINVLSVNNNNNNNIGIIHNRPKTISNQKNCLKLLFLQNHFDINCIQVKLKSLYA